MSNEKPLPKREELQKRAEEIRSDVEDNKKLGMSVRDDIEELLDKALEDLDGKDDDRTRNKAGFKIGKAKQRIYQAETQDPSWAIPIAFWMAGFIAIGVTWIALEQLWPKTDNMPVRSVLLASVLWGLLGASIDGLRELHTRLARQEFDPKRLGWYLAHPVIGAGIGGILFLLVSGGLLVAGKEVDEYNPSLPMLLAALAGFEQQYVIRYLREVVRNILRIEKPSPDEGG